MKVGLVYPQTEFGNDPAAIRDYAQTAEALGYTHISSYEHILGANPERPGGWHGPYTYRDPFHDPFVMYSYMAGFTESLEFATGILVLPLRETAVVAKQAATLDILSGGRFRLGLGVGWNKVEFTALGQDFHQRGQRIDEQIELLNLLWTRDLVTYQGKWHTVPDAGLNPRPAKPIPLWMGGHADAVLRRIARVGQGWLPGYHRADQSLELLAKLDQFLAEFGRSRSDIGIEWRLHYNKGTPDDWQRTIQGWQAVGATHMSLNTMNAGLDTAAQHLQAIRRFAAEMM